MLTDQQGRQFHYLRLSVTDQCNFRCVYCLPEGYQAPSLKPVFLTPPEIKRLVTAFTEMGVSKVRLTGGEPTLRKDLLSIARDIKNITAVKKLHLSTNGYRLLNDAEAYLDAGITGINISIDSLRPAVFRELTGHDKLDAICAGIDKAVALGMPSIKINVVLMNGINNDELPLFLAWAKSAPVTIRFIELMPTGINRALFEKRHLRTDWIESELSAAGWVQATKAYDAGPAREYRHERYRGSIGVIAPYSKDFCQSCNRLRVTSLGALRLCLFGDGEHSLRALLQRDEDKARLKETVAGLLSFKAPSHALQDNKIGNVIHFAEMGG